MQGRAQSPSHLTIPAIPAETGSRTTFDHRKHTRYHTHPWGALDQALEQKGMVGEATMLGSETDRARTARAWADMGA